MIIKKPTRKKLLTLLIFTAAAAVLAGCAAQNVFEGTMATDTNGFSMEYTILDGTQAVAGAAAAEHRSSFPTRSSGVMRRRISIRCTQN